MKNKNLNFIKTGCGGDVYNVKGVVTSPMYPTAYTEISDCRWNLKVPDGHLIGINFNGKHLCVNFSKN